MASYHENRLHTLFNICGRIVISFGKLDEQFIQYFSSLKAQTDDSSRLHADHQISHTVHSAIHLNCLANARFLNVAVYRLNTAWSTDDYPYVD